MSATIAPIDDTLVVRSQAGDPEAMSELATQVRPLVQRYASRFFADPGRAEDLTQTALMKAFSRVGDVRSPEAFPAWLLRITRNECLNELSRQRHVQITLSAFDEGGATLEAPGGGEDDPEEELVRGQLQDLVRRVAATLPPHYRRTLTMRALEDRSYEEISVALDVPVTVARLWYCRARKRFRRAFVEAMVARRGVPAACFDLGVSIAEMIEGTLGRSERDRLQEHLSGCSVCRQTEDELRNTAFRAPARSILIGLGALKIANTVRRHVTSAASAATQAAGRMVVVGAGSLTVAAASTVPAVVATGDHLAFAAPAASAAHVSPSAGAGAPALVADATQRPPAASDSSPLTAAPTAPVGGVLDAVSPGTVLSSLEALLPRAVRGPVHQLDTVTAPVRAAAAAATSAIGGTVAQSTGTVVATTEAVVAQLGAATTGLLTGH